MDDQPITAPAPPRVPLPARVTLREIAAEAGVSIATVSRVLNTPSLVAEATRAAVQAVIARHDYVADGIAGALAGARSMTLGVIIPTIVNSVYAQSTQAIQHTAQAAGYAVLLGVSDFDPAEEATLVRRLIERRVDGVILTGATRAPAVWRLLHRHQVATVVTWQPLSPAGDDPAQAAAGSVAFDNYAAARLAMAHLLALGHRRIALLCGDTRVNDRARDRRRAWADALTQAGLAADPTLALEGEFEFAVGHRAMLHLLDQPIRPSAVFAANDIQAVGALTACHSRGVAVPAQLAIIGFDDLPVTQLTQPQLSTVRVPASTMGELAVRQILARQQGGAAPQHALLPVELVVRGSTGPAPVA